MMKSFFKKLAFVMALAMVVSLAAPAATTAAAAEDLKVAYQNGGTITELNLAKAGDKEDLKFLGAPNWKEEGHSWTSSNPAVATVDPAGVVTAVADGVAVITITVGTKTGSVKVNVGEVKPYDVTLGTADDKAMTEVTLEEAETIDLNFYGVKDWSTSKYSCTWISNAPEVATVSQKDGVVTAVAAGTATVTIAIVNNTTGETLNVTPVVVTVPAKEVAPAFTIKQLDTVTVTLTFDEAIDLSAAVADDFEITAIDETFEYTLFANTMSVDKNVVTLTFVEGVLSDGATIKIGYKTEENILVASNGEVKSVQVSYGMTKDYAYDAFVYTELDPDYVLLTYKLFDAKGIDVTANYEENEDYAIEWALLNGSEYASEPEEDFDNGWQMSFDEKGSATVQATVTFTDEEGEDRDVKSLPVTITAKNRPEIRFTFEEAGLVNIGSKDNTEAYVNSFNTWDGTIWSTNAYDTSLSKGASRWFGARLTDNRGNGLVSTVLTYTSDPDRNIEFSGSTEYADYGYFVYESSNEDVLDIDDEGYVTGVEVGTATILVSFVKYTEDGEEMDPVKVCSKKISVTAVCEEPYAKTFTLTESLSVTSTGASEYETAYLKFYDQHGHSYAPVASGSALNNATIITVPEAYKEANLVFGDPVNAWYTGYEWAYPVTISGDALNDLVTIKDNGYYTFKFTVAVDTDLDDFSKVTTKNDKLSVKVYNVDKYYAELTAFFNGDLKDAATTDYTKWNYVIDGGASVNAYVDKRSEFGSGDTSATPAKSISVELNSTAGLKLMDLPEDYFIQLDEKVDDINKKLEEDRDLVEGAIYYQISVPSKADNYEVATGSAVTFTFNEVIADEIQLATEGSYTVTMYYVNSQNKLTKLSGSPTSVVVTNTTPGVKAEGFIDTNVYDTTVNGDIADTEDSVIEALEKMYNFTWNGELLYNADTEVTSDNFKIDSVKYTWSEDKVVVTEITFAIDYFNDCEKVVFYNEEEDRYVATVDNDYSELYQLYTLKKRITIKTDK